MLYNLWSGIQLGRCQLVQAAATRKAVAFIAFFLLRIEELI